MNALINWIPGFKKIQGEGVKTLKPEDLVEPQFVGDARVDITNQITEFLTCSTCDTERPEATSHVDWMRLSIGMTVGGLIQVWCMRHNRNVTLFHARS